MSYLQVVAQRDPGAELQVRYCGMIRICTSSPACGAEERNHGDDVRSGSSRSTNLQFSPWISLGHNLQYDMVGQRLGCQARLNPATTCFSFTLITLQQPARLGRGVIDYDDSSALGP